MFFENRYRGLWIVGREKMPRDHRAPRSANDRGRFMVGAPRRGDGFMLLEIVVSVAIFSLAVLALGRCMGECLDTQGLCNQRQRAVLALQNRMIEIQASPIMPDAFSKHALKGMFNGMTMIERRRTLDIKNDDNSSLSNLQEVTLTAEWPVTGKETQSSSLSFIVLRGNE